MKKITLMFGCVFFVNFIFSASQPKNTCNFCNELLGNRWIETEGKKYHEKCYKENIQKKCAICKKPIAGEYTIDSEGEYHKECYINYKLDKCAMCGNPLEGKYIVDYWGNKVHESHGTSKTLICDSCGRAVSEKTSKGGFKTNDGRIICGICEEDSVSNSSQIPMIKKEVSNMLKNRGITIPVIQDIVLTDSPNIKRMAGFENSLGFANTEKKTINNKVVKIEHTIYILHSLQRIKFMGVLAHEMLHTWLQENDIKMSHKDTEGFCNLGTYLVYSESSEPIAGYLLKQLNENEDPIYGDGYRQMKKMLDKYGWKVLIEKIRM